MDEIVLDPYLESLKELYEEMKTSAPVIPNKEIEKLLSGIKEVNTNSLNPFPHTTNLQQMTLKT